MFTFISFGLFLFFAVHNSVASPLIVTRTVGTVFVQDGKKLEPVSKSIFALKDDQALILDKKALVTVLYQGKGKQIVGPTTISVEEMKIFPIDNQKESPLTLLITRKSSIVKTGASRSLDGFQLKRPLETGDILELKTIEWICNSCGEQRVSVVNVENNSTAWSSPGTDVLTYSGPVLEEGKYLIQIGDRSFPFTVVSDEEKQIIQEALTVLDIEADTMKLVDRLSLMAALLNQADLKTEALYLLDVYRKKNPQDSDIQELYESYELMSFSK